MSLTGRLFLAVMLAAVAGGFLALVWFWPRWAGGGARAVLTRAALLAAVNALVLLTAAVAMNDQFGFFADWTDLGGVVGLVGTAATSDAHAGGDPRVALSRPVDGSRAAPGLPPALPAQIARGSRLVSFTVDGPASGIRAQVDVYLPAGYTDSAQRLRRYPVLEAFPGYPGGPFVPADAVATVVDAHRLVDPIIVSPVVEIPAGRDTECVDGTPRDPKVETWLTRDVPDWAQRTLRVRPDRTSWATIGWSAGGWCAAMAAMLHPDRYAAAIVLGGYFRPDFGALYAPFLPDSPQGRRYDLVALASRRPPAVALWIQTSQADRLSYPTSAQLLAKARPPLSVQSLVMAHAGHRTQVWIPLLPHALTWLAATASGFSPASPAPTGPAPAWLGSSSASTPCCLSARPRVSFSPSTSTSGMARSSHAGSHQALSPSSDMTAGMRVIRTTKASSRTPTASARPMDLMTVSLARMKPAKTLPMMMPAAVTTRAPWANPLTTLSIESAP